MCPTCVCDKLGWGMIGRCGIRFINLYLIEQSDWFIYSSHGVVVVICLCVYFIYIFIYLFIYHSFSLFVSLLSCHVFKPIG